MTTALRNSIVLACVLAAFLTASTLVVSQSTVTGKVTDGIGNAVADVQVQLIQNYECKCSDCNPVDPKPCPKCCAPQRTTHTNDDGIYKFEGIPQGEYRLEVSASGFAPIETRVTVTGDKTTVVDVNFNPGNVGDTVKVNDQCSLFCKFARLLRKIF